jgi:hypothetical protein
MEKTPNSLIDDAIRFLLRNKARFTMDFGLLNANLANLWALKAPTGTGRNHRQD